MRQNSQSNELRYIVATHDYAFVIPTSLCSQQHEDPKVKIKLHC